MYRDIGQFDKAIANFEKANQVDPKHVQSLFNLGVVYAHDLKQPKKADGGLEQGHPARRRRASRRRRRAGAAAVEEAK